ncbi:MAG: alpha/beta fold hydrolase [Actinomycetia bacterium]|nr:alpha/beta fold hydrolase [Actinomycetes bacterium]
MGRTETIETPHGPITAVIEQKTGSGNLPILFAHGAGLGQHHDWMVAVRSRLVDRGHLVMTFDYLYMHEGRKAPDRLPKLLDVHEAAAEALENIAGEVVLVGKSMGGRVGSHLVAQGRCNALGLVYLGYPLVAMGKTEPRNIDHLLEIDLPQLFVSGTRDRMGPVEQIDSVAASVPNGSSVLIDDGDHSLIPRKKSGRTLDDNLDDAVGAIETWVAGNG